MKNKTLGLAPFSNPQIPQFDTKFMSNVESFAKMTDRTYRDIFKGEIRGGFLIEMKNLIVTALGTTVLQLYDFQISDERLATTGLGGVYDYEICKIIIGIHHANTVFLSTEKANAKMHDEEYKKQLFEKAVEEIYIRRYGAAFFRSQAFVTGERFIYYPVPYMLFVFCTRMNEIFTQSYAITESSTLLSLIMNKSLAALSLIEDGFLDSAYMPCRSVIEMYVKLMLLRTDKRLFSVADRFAYYDLEKTNCSKKYTNEFNSLFVNRTNKGCRSKVDFMHYGFVDSINGYHDIVKQNPYSINGILDYLKASANEADIERYVWLESFYKSCHGYTHGNVIKSRYSLLHYFELSMILGLIVPKVYEIVCEEANADKRLGFDILNEFQKDFDLLKQQYIARSTENFDMEIGKYSYHIKG